jgi:hypothetical protein
MSPSRPPDPVTLSLRVYSERTDREPRSGSPYVTRGWVQDVLFLDTETTTDQVQRLKFGSWRHCIWDAAGGLQCIEEGIIFADDLPTRDPAGFALLKKYIRMHRADVAPGVQKKKLRFMSRTEFLYEVFYHLAFRARALVVGFNLPFDLTRLVGTWGEARGKYYGGFSCVLWQRRDGETGELRERAWYPRLWLKVINSKLSFMQFVSPRQLDPLDADPTDAGKKYVYGGAFLDLRTLAFALTSTSHSLASACEAFKVEHGKQPAVEHGVISADYIDYNRRDVLATAELLVAVRRVFDAHPVAMNPCKAFSPASMSKGYMRALGVVPPRLQFAGLPKEILGIAMNGFFGGRAEAGIRNEPVPVVHTDFTSMYPTVGALLGTWDVITADELAVADYTAEASRLLEEATLERYMTPDPWRNLLWFAEIEPDEDILPVRANYDRASDVTNNGVNHLTSDQPLWCAGPDLIAAKILGKEAPRIRRAIVLRPRGKQPGLQPVTFPGGARIDPVHEDFFRAIIEQRKTTEANTSIPEEERRVASQALKILANAGSYGIYVEMNAEDLPKGEAAPVKVFSMGRSFHAPVPHPEEAGEYFFAPVAVLITAGARLMLALLEKHVTDAGGVYAFCDTDSMAIVATKRGGLVPCEGGPHRTRDGRPAVRALSRKQVHDIRQRFVALNPYNHHAVPGSILRAEAANFDNRGRPRQLFAYVISAKRYCLYSDVRGRVVIVKGSEHGLGHLLAPDGVEGDWIEETWAYIVNKTLKRGRRVPAFFKQAALSRITTSSPHVLRPFTEAHSTRPFEDRIRPMNFILSASVRRFGGPPGVDLSRFHLLHPYATDRSALLQAEWTDLYSGAKYRVTTGRYASPDVVRIRSYGDVIAEHEMNPESRSAGPDGEPCGRNTSGLLQRRHLRVEEIRLVGKESNRLEDVEQGIVHDWGEVCNVYYDPQLDPWPGIVARLRAYPTRKLAAVAGVSERAIRALRNGHSRPSPETRQKLLAFLKEG